MSPTTIPNNLYWPFILYALLTLVLVAGMYVLSYLLGERHRERATTVPYESGMPPTGSARVRFPADYYLIAMFFVIFDLETVFIVTWAIAIRQLGWLGYLEVTLFIAILLVSLAYLWRIGALDWGTSGRAACANIVVEEERKNATL